MPSNNAANTPAEKAAKQPAAHDLRRAYEHLGRIEILEGALAGTSFVDVSLLAALARRELSDGDDQSAADLLRAAEHLCFAALAPRRKSPDTISPDLEDAVASEFNHLTRSAKDHWDYSHSDDMASLYTRTLKQAYTALDRCDYRPALELARAAEALTHIFHSTTRFSVGQHERRPAD